MKENIEELRANVEHAEENNLHFITMPRKAGRAVLDYIAHLESAAAPAAGQAGLAKLERWAPHPRLIKAMELSERGNFVKFIDVQKLLATLAAPVAAAPASFFDALETFKQSDQGVTASQRFADAVIGAPVAADTEQATIDTPEFRALLEAHRKVYNAALKAFDPMDDDRRADNEVAAAWAALISHIDSVKLAPLATPADAGAGAEQPSLSNDEIDAIWQSMPGGPSHWLKGFGYQQFAKAVEAEVLLNVERARLSTPGAPVTASDDRRQRDELAAALGLESGANFAWSYLLGLVESQTQFCEASDGLSATPAAIRNQTLEEIAKWYGEAGWLMDEEDIAEAIRAFKGQSPAPVTAEPVEMPGAQMDDIVDNLREFASNAGYSHNDYQDTMRQAANVIEHLRAQFFHWRPDHIATPAPADRDAIRDQALESRPSEWAPVTGPGQVKVGDRLRFTIGDKSYSERAKIILHAGTDKEEVIYNRKRNFYFITAMVMSGFSNHKNVESHPSASPTATDEQKGGQQ